MQNDERFSESVRALDRAHQIAREYVAGLANRPVSHAIDAEEMKNALDEPLPEGGIDPVQALSEWMERAEPGIVASSGPRFFGYVIGGTTPAALAGDWLAATIDQDAGLWPAGPAAAETEFIVIRWLKELFNLPAAWAGTLTSGATQANLVGLAAARQWVGTELGFNPATDGLGGHPAIPVISSSEIHASARKALGTLGIGNQSVITIPSHAGLVDLDELESALNEISGPVIVVANAGEVNTGAFDPLDSIADLCADHAGGAWLHVDGAFGLFAALSPKTAPFVAGIERADSVAADGHKWLNVPYDSGFAFVRDGSVLRSAFAVAAAYLNPAGGMDPADYLPDFSKRFRGLPAWCALKAYGRAGYKHVVEMCLKNAASFAAWVDSTAGLELMAPTNFNVVCFRYTPDGLDDAATDSFNRDAIARIQADERAFVTSTTWNGRTSIRAAFDNWATSPEDIRILQEAVADIGSLPREE